MQATREDDKGTNKSFTSRERAQARTNPLVFFVAFFVGPLNTFGLSWYWCVSGPKIERIRAL
jgi:hypothetical protein